MWPARQRTFIPYEDRFGRALYELRCGNDMSWGFWLDNASYQAMSLISLDFGSCSLHPKSPPHS